MLRRGGLVYIRRRTVYCGSPREWRPVLNREERQRFRIWIRLAS